MGSKRINFNVGKLHVGPPDIVKQYLSDILYYFPKNINKIIFTYSLPHYSSCILKNNLNCSEEQITVFPKGCTQKKLLQYASSRFGYKVTKLYHSKNCAIKKISELSNGQVVYASAGECYIDYTDPYKIAIMGDVSGKTSMVHRFITGNWFDRVKLTQYEDWFATVMETDNQTYTLDILDTNGRLQSVGLPTKDVAESWAISAISGTSTMRQSWMYQCEGLIFVFDITCKRTFYSLNDFLSLYLDTFDGIPKPPSLIVGNRSDRNCVSREVSFDDGKKIAEHYGSKYIETSAKTGKNIEHIFENIVKDIQAFRCEKSVSLK